MSDRDLYSRIGQSIDNRNYIFLKHAKQRLEERQITDIDGLDILEGKAGRKRLRNKKNDSYQSGQAEWKYCIEGINLDGLPIRIIISFEKGYMPIITVINLN